MSRDEDIIGIADVDVCHGAHCVNIVELIGISWHFSMADLVTIKQTFSHGYAVTQGFQNINFISIAFHVLSLSP